MNGEERPEQLDVVVVGGGQAGLATGQQLSRRGISYAILDANARCGDTWRQRWDSLRLFTPARYDGLPGLPFPAPPSSYPTRDEMADYLETYAERFRLPVRHGVRVDRVTRRGDTYLVRAGDRTLEAAHVIVATGGHQTGVIPPLARALDPEIVQLHSGDYRDPGQLRSGATLVVGAGNSGAEIAIEAAVAGHRTYLAGRGTGSVPPVAYALGGRPFWFFANKVLSVATPVGRRARPRILGSGGPLIRLSMRQVLEAGVERVPKVTATRGGLPVLGDGRTAEVANVVWCTGFGHDFSWIDLPVIGAGGRPEHDRGIVRTQPGLSFVGLPFQSKLASAFIGGVGGDAAYVVRQVAANLGTRSRGARIGARAGSSAA